MSSDQRENVATEVERMIEQMDFESALAHLESIVGQLELGQVGLTESLEHYENGVKYLKRCYHLLAAAEKRVEVLQHIDSDGTCHTTPWEHEADAESLTEKAERRSQRRSANATVASSNSDEDPRPDGVPSKRISEGAGRRRSGAGKVKKKKKQADSMPAENEDHVDGPRGLF